MYKSILIYLHLTPTTYEAVYCFSVCNNANTNLKISIQKNRNSIGNQKNVIQVQRPDRKTDTYNREHNITKIIRPMQKS